MRETRCEMAVPVSIIGAAVLTQQRNQLFLRVAEECVVLPLVYSRLDVAMLVTDGKVFGYFGGAVVR